MTNFRSHGLEEEEEDESEKSGFKLDLPIDRRRNKHQSICLLCPPSLRLSPSIPSAYTTLKALPPPLICSLLRHPPHPKLTRLARETRLHMCRKDRQGRPTTTRVGRTPMAWLGFFSPSFLLPLSSPGGERRGGRCCSRLGGEKQSIHPCSLPFSPAFHRSIVTPPGREREEEEKGKGARIKDALAPRAAPAEKKASGFRAALAEFTSPPLPHNV